MVIDVCLFCGEMEMLKFRLRALYLAVDKFIIIEANKTHSGKPRQRTLKSEIPRSLPWALDCDCAKTKLCVHEVNLRASGTWEREFEQRNALIAACEAYKPNDLVIMGDLDEIPSLEAIRLAKSNPFALPKSCQQAFFYYNMHNLRREDWRGSIIATLAQFRALGPQNLRNQRSQLPTFLNAGWHFSYFGDVASIQAKLASFSHEEYNIPKYLNPAHIQACRNSGADLFERGTAIETVNDDFFPAYIRSAAQASGWMKCNTETGIQEGISWVITSAGRPDLLRRTLESFLRYNTTPIVQTILIEDGPANPPNVALPNLTYIANGKRIGQLRSIDRAYAQVRHKYIFHCEDDWEFLRPGFIEQSLKILEANPEIFQVWIRQDTPYRIDDTRQDLRVLDINKNSCCTLTWNPALRRTADYLRIGGNYEAIVGDRFGVLTELQLSQYYKRLGFRAAALPEAYVCHIGDKRHVVDPLESIRNR